MRAFCPWNTAWTLCGTSLWSGRGAGLSTAVITALNTGLLRFTCCVTAFASVYLARCVAAHFSLILHPHSNQYKQLTPGDYFLSFGELILHTPFVWAVSFGAAEASGFLRKHRRREVFNNASARTHADVTGRDDSGTSSPPHPTPRRHHPEQTNSVSC